MNRKKCVFLTIIITLLMSILMVGCGADLTKSPEELYAELYGSAEFEITFYSELLETPLEDMTYTASNMPILPIPSKVGYIFNGWYMDKEYSKPYYDGILYLYMTDITMYARWESEQFAQYGVYDVEISSKIVDGSVKKGELTDQYGGYKDISDHFIKDNCFLEKSTEGLQLRLQYDNEVTIPFTESLFPFNVSVDSLMRGTISISSSIMALSEPIHTQYINVDDFDLSQSMYFNVIYRNYTTAGMTQDEINATQTSYTIEVTLTRIIGFSKSYQDTSMVLDDGYYEIRTSFLQINNSETMGQQFNPEFSYIQAKSGRYTLIKPMYPYAGLTSGITSTDYKDVYFERLAAFCNSILCYPITRPTTDIYTDIIDYYPEYLSGEKYCNFTLEYHADKGMFYTIIDLGTSLDKDFAFTMGVTGFMEVVSGMGHIDLVMIPDYDHIIKVSDIGFSQLDGYSFTYSDQYAYYPGNTNDFADKTIVHDTITQYGLTLDINNFFYSTANAEGVKSFRISSSPTIQTGATNVADQQGQIAIFDRVIEVFDYDAKTEKLYADIMGSQVFGSTALRYVEEVRIGKSYNVGDYIDLEAVIQEKVNKDLTLSKVDYTAYEMNGYVVDFSAETRLTSTSYFSKNIAVLVEWSDGYCIIEIVENIDPTINFTNTSENTYIPDTRYTNGDTVYFPIITYDYMGVQTEFYGNFYESDDNYVNPTTVALFNYNQGLYVYNSAVGSTTKTFTITAEEVYAYYQIQNLYGEIYDYTLLFSSYETAVYSIYDSSNDYLVKEVSYRTNSSGNYVYNTQSAGYEYTSLYDIYYNTFFLYTKNYTYFPKTSQMTLSSITMSSSNYSNLSASITSYSAFENYYNTYFSNSTYVTFKAEYYADDVTLYVSYVRDITYNGTDSPYLFNEDTYFINTLYEVDRPQLITSSGELLSLGSITIAKLDGNITTNSGVCISRGYLALSEEKYHYEIMFMLTGTWQITYNYGQTTFVQVIDVKSDVAEVTITYVTTPDQLFADGSTQKKVSYSLADNIIWLSTGSTSSPIFADIPVANNGDTRLYGWSQTEGLTLTSSGTKYIAGKNISDFIGTFGSLEITVYAVWDYGFRVNLVASYYDSSNTSVFYQTTQESVYGSSSYVVTYYSFSLSSLETSVTDLLAGKYDANNKLISNTYQFKYFSYSFGGSAITSSSLYYSYSGTVNIYANFGAKYTVTYNPAGVGGQYASYYNSSLTYIINSTNIIEGTTVFDTTYDSSTTNTITNKYNITMASAYSGYMLDYYVYYNGSSYVKWDFDNTKVSSAIDNADGTLDNTIHLYAVYTQIVTVQYNVSGYNDIYSGYSYTTITDSTEVRVGSRVGEHMFVKGETAYVADKITIRTTDDSYSFQSWAYLNSSGSLIFINLYTDDIVFDMDYNGDGVVQLYAVYERKFKIEFTSGNDTFTESNIYAGSSLYSQMGSTAINQLMNTQNPDDSSQKVSYWAYENASGQLVVFNLYTGIISADLDINGDGTIILIAVYS